MVPRAPRAEGPLVNVDQDADAGRDLLLRQTRQIDVQYLPWSRRCRGVDALR